MSIAIAKKAGINVVRVNTPRLRGRFGWTRLRGDVLERSKYTYPTEQAAWDNAVLFYRLGN